jgi:hypothetical protein|tara:strand:- start:4410 stop:4595 length:186 start_codon:yes stop_codon:yes gene_type:complete
MAGLQFVGVGAFILRACPYPANTPAMKRQQALGCRASRYKLFSTSLTESQEWRHIHFMHHK